MFLCNFLNLGVYSLSQSLEGLRTYRFGFALSIWKRCFKEDQLVNLIAKLLSWFPACSSLHWMLCTEQTPWHLLRTRWAVLSDLRGLRKPSYCWRKRSARADATLYPVSLLSSTTQPFLFPANWVSDWQRSRVTKLVLKLASFFRKIFCFSCGARTTSQEEKRDNCRKSFNAAESSVTTVPFLPYPSKETN